MPNYRLENDLVVFKNIQEILVFSGAGLSAESGLST